MAAVASHSVFILLRKDTAFPRCTTIINIIIYAVLHIQICCIKSLVIIRVNFLHCC